MKTIFRISGLILWIIIIHSCEEKPSPPTVTTTTVTEISQTTATSGGEVTNEGVSPVVSRGICWNISANPTIANNKTVEGGGFGTFTSNLTQLIPNTQYYARAYATNGAGTGYGNEVSFTTESSSSGILFNPDLKYGTVIDIDGNIYKTIEIGTNKGVQTWMAENLRTTSFNDGESIPLVTNKSEWWNISTPGFSKPAYCWYDNKKEENKFTYGALYNGYAVETGKLCPTGWNVPTNNDWKILTDFLGGERYVAGGMLKETGTTHWTNPNYGATNETGFTALPGGDRNHEGNFFGIKNYGFWWSSTGSFTGTYYNKTMYYIYPNVSTSSDSYGCGLSIRCIKDN